MKRIATILFAGVLLFGGTGHAAQSLSAPEMSNTGTIQKLNFGTNSMIIDGYRYYVAPDVHVEIRGTFGAFTMLQTGMKVYMVYRLISGTEREIVEIKQLPDNTVLEET